MALLLQSWGGVRLLLCPDETREGGGGSVPASPPVSVGLAGEGWAGGSAPHRSPLRLVWGVRRIGDWPCLITTVLLLPSGDQGGARCWTTGLPWLGTRSSASWAGNWESAATALTGTAPAGNEATSCFCWAGSEDAQSQQHCGHYRNGGTGALPASTPAWTC